MTNLTHEKLLSIVIPCYGKTNDVVRRTLDSVDLSLQNSNNEMEVIFVYKNSNEMNYDWVKNSYKNFKVIGPANSEYKKFGKMKEGLFHTSSKFSYVLDSDDLLMHENISELLGQLKKNIDKDIIIFDYIRRWEKSGKELLESDGTKFSKNKKKIVLTNFNVLFSNEIIKKTIPFIEPEVESIIFNQDLFYTILNLIENKDKEIGFITIPFLKYIKYELSNSTLKGMKQNSSTIDSIKLLDELAKQDFGFEANNNKKIISYTLNRLILSSWFESCILKRKIEYKKMKVNYKAFKHFLLKRHKFMYYLTYRIHLLKRFYVRWAIFLFVKEVRDK